MRQKESVCTRGFPCTQEYHPDLSPNNKVTVTKVRNRNTVRSGKVERTGITNFWGVIGNITAKLSESDRRQDEKKQQKAQTCGTSQTLEAGLQLFGPKRISKTKERETMDKSRKQTYRRQKSFSLGGRLTGWTLGQVKKEGLAAD